MFLLVQSCSLITTAAVLVLLFQQSNAKIAAVAVFRRDEVDYHKYSAVLAAIEPFRLQLSEEIKKSLNPISYAYHKIIGNELTSPHDFDGFD